MSGVSRVPPPRNEPILSYAPGAQERAPLKAALVSASREVVDIPLFIGGARERTTSTPVVMPHDHRHVVARVHAASESHVERAIEAAEMARPEWSALPFEERASVFLRAADLLTGLYRWRMNASTMLGQSKTAHQAEIDAVAELADFWRFNVAYARQILEDQPLSPPGAWNRLEHRPLDGFVFAVTPFNFTAIGGNLPTAPAIMGNTVVWKPASTQVLAACVTMEILLAAGLPPGVINLVAGEASRIAGTVIASPRLGGLHFTGSVATFNRLWSAIGKNIDRYEQYPRIVGETGGKDFIFAHASADVAALACATIRGGFEYQGQKCSAASRLYVPRTLWSELKERLVSEIGTIRVGDVQDFSSFMGAVIDARAFESITGYIELAKSSPDVTVLAGGTYDGSTGWFIRPTLLETADPKHRLMREEIFGPVVTVYVYDESRLEETLELCDTTAPFALTGAVFARDRYAVERISRRLAGAAGNFYVNDKPTGAVVGQQPFGGSRGSGTNDKAGSAANLLRWISARAIKETFVPPTDYRYAFLGEP